MAAARRCDDSRRSVVVWHPQTTANFRSFISLSASAQTKLCFFCCVSAVVYNLKIGSKSLTLAKFAILFQFCRRLACAPRSLPRFTPRNLQRRLQVAATAATLLLHFFPTRLSSLLALSHDYARAPPSPRLGASNCRGRLSFARPFIARSTCNPRAMRPANAEFLKRVARILESARF